MLLPCCCCLPLWLLLLPACLPPLPILTPALQLWHLSCLNAYALTSDISPAASPPPLVSAASSSHPTPAPTTWDIHVRTKLPHPAPPSPPLLITTAQKRLKMSHPVVFYWLHNLKCLCRIISHDLDHLDVQRSLGSDTTQCTYFLHTFAFLCLFVRTSYPFMPLCTIWNLSHTHFKHMTMASNSKVRMIFELHRGDVSRDQIDLTLNSRHICKLSNLSINSAFFFQFN